MYVETFAEKLRSARIKMGVTQKQVSAATGIPQSTISKYENKELEPCIEYLGILADFYEVSVDWLIGTKGSNRVTGG